MRNERIRFAAIVWARREALDLTQRELAEKLGVDQTTVSKWEKAERMPTYPEQTRIAHLLGFDLQPILFPESESQFSRLIDAWTSMVLKKKKRPPNSTIC